MDDRETMVPWLRWDGKRMTGEDVLRIRRLVRGSGHLTDAEVESLILREMAALLRLPQGTLAV